MNDSLKLVILSFSLFIAGGWSKQSISDELDRPQDFSKENRYINDALEELHSENQSFKTEHIKISEILRELREANEIQKPEVVTRQEFDLLYTESVSINNKSSEQKLQLYQKYSKQTGLSVDEIKDLFESEFLHSKNPMPKENVSE